MVKARTLLCAPLLNASFMVHTQPSPTVITLFSKRTVITVFSPRRAWSRNVGLKLPLPEFSSPPSREDAPQGDDDADDG